MTEIRESAHSLLPCPHCGGDAIFEDAGFNHMRVSCANSTCRVESRVHKNKDYEQRLVAQWNARHNAHDALVVALKKIHSIAALQENEAGDGTFYDIIEIAEAALKQAGAL